MRDGREAAFTWDGYPVYQGDPGPLTGKPHVCAFGFKSDGTGEPVLSFFSPMLKNPEEIVRETTGGYLSGYGSDHNGVLLHAPGGHGAYPESLDLRAGERTLDSNGDLDHEIREALSAAYPRERFLVAVEDGKIFGLASGVSRENAKYKTERRKIPVLTSLSVSPDEEMEPARRAVEIIDRVHACQPLPRIPVVRDLSLMAHGQYDMGRRHGSGQMVDSQITINTTESTQRRTLSTVAHEIGHFIDHWGFGEGREAFASERSEQDVPDKDTAPTSMASLIQTIHASDALRKLDDMSQNPKKYQQERRIEKEHDGEVVQEVVLIEPDQKHLDYYRAARECFAWAYSQWIAVRSGDPVMLQEIESWHEHYRGKKLLYPSAWTDKDFAPIAASMDELFRSKGWLHDTPNAPNNTTDIVPL